jgi:tetratricopeptide (TPR) repeat protein
VTLTSGALVAYLMCAAALALAQDTPDRLLAAANAAYRSFRAAEAADLYRQYLALYPDRADVRVYFGGALLNLDRLQAAFEQAKRAIEFDPRYAKGYILAGRVCAAREQWDQAQSYFATAKQLDGRDADAWYFSGRAHYDANRFEQAIAVFEQALRIGAEQSRVYENLGLAQDALSQFSGAERSFREALELANGSWRPYLAYGAFLFRQDRPAESLRVLRQALKLAPAEADVRFELARVLYHENNLAEAAEVLAPANASNQCRIHNLLARIDSARGESGLAEIEIKAMGDCKATRETP